MKTSKVLTFPTVLSRIVGSEIKSYQGMLRLSKGSLSCDILVSERPIEGNL